MSASYLVELEITNPAAMEPYRAAVGATIEQYGGRVLARAGTTELIEGGPEPKRIVILEFADTAACKRRYDSTGYQKILPMRLDNSTGRAFIDAGIVESRLSRQSPTYSRIRGSTYCLGAVKHYPGNA